MHLVGYLYEDYHDARSLEHKVCLASTALRQDANKTRQRDQTHRETKWARNLGSVRTWTYIFIGYIAFAFKELQDRHKAWKRDVMLKGYITPSYLGAGLGGRTV
jgi:hypothetical protein